MLDKTCTDSSLAYPSVQQTRTGKARHLEQALGSLDVQTMEPMSIFSPGPYCTTPPLEQYGPYPYPCLQKPPSHDNRYVSSLSGLAWEIWSTGNGWPKGRWMTVALRRCGYGIGSWPH
jgi:hypothetical protein